MRRFSFFFISLIVLGFLSCSRSKEPLPEKVNQLLLVKTITGQEAKDYINKLHFQPVTENENLIGYYENASGSAVVYVTLYKSNSDAENDFVKMTKKISPENSVFIYPQFFEQEGNQIYKCFGMGMTHFVFVSDKKLYWISVDTHLANDFLNEFYKLVK